MCTKIMQPCAEEWVSLNRKFGKPIIKPKLWVEITLTVDISTVIFVCVHQLWMWISEPLCIIWLLILILFFRTTRSNSFFFFSNWTIRFPCEFKTELASVLLTNKYLKYFFLLWTKRKTKKCVWSKTDRLCSSLSMKKKYGDCWPIFKN